ncbi:glycosyltransferase involved in cell wall biosynthesis [Diaminobutyricimonas aerilata]|uniref:Glycosyltransferase involved in cell wall biosynthesis n=1 Tax=Diaminobutyricimonas aerilata TaxID=1162967 RepID=A0A2M9CH70_9MICO|nr:glycosyltransferase family 2 protein [Diaminobutyricimonas aerilata]PJJ71229.1 glycosyltransferase involved in cell wall biosynthesis [Diaminobutyricimonas aerilata]
MRADFSGILIVVPAWNEEESVGAVVRDVRHTLPGATCLVVDDGSTDSTSLRAKEAGARVVRLPFNLGVGGAMRLGFKFARDAGFDAVVQIDADGQHNPADVPALLDALRTSDIAIGARFAGVGEYAARGPRRWAMRLLSSVLSRVARTKLTDTTSGFRACGPKAMAIFAENYPAEYLGDTIEALVIAAREGCVLTQVPVAMNPRMAGTPSHNPAKAAVYLARVVLSLVFALVKPTSSYREAAAT